MTEMTSDEKYWVQIRRGVIEALEAEGLQIVSDRDGVRLHRMPNWQPVPPRSCIKPTHEAADAFWAHWNANGVTHRHGYYESTWGAINKALACGWTPPNHSRED